MPPRSAQDDSVFTQDDSVFTQDDSVFARDDDVTYVELRAHSAFSFGDGAVAPDKLVAQAKALGYKSLGLTDHGDLGGIVRFAMQAKQEEIQPIVGVELLVDGYPAAFLARTAEGYRNIAALVTRARAGRLEDLASPEVEDAPISYPSRGRPIVTWQDVAERSTGIHALTGPASGRLASLLYERRRDDAVRLLAQWREVFGKRLAVEVQLHHAGRFEEALAGSLIKLAEREKIEWIVAGNPRYTDQGGRLVHDVLTALRAGLTLKEATQRGMLHPNESWGLISPEDMAIKWRGAERGLEATAAIAAECDFSMSWLRPPLPKYPVPHGHDDNTFLREKTYEGARIRWKGQISDVQEHQLEHELALIEKLNFSGFFLVMWDGVHEAHKRNILCQGRGSAANSAVAYCLGITAVDPIKHGLLFERFLSEVRVDGKTEAPDIDVDVEHDRREELLNYMYGNWRRENAAITCVVQMYSAPTAIQDTMRAYGYPLEVAFALSKRIHRTDPADGAEALREEWCKEYGFEVNTPEADALVRTVAAFEGLPRMRSTHPGGFVLSSGALGHYCPIEPTTMGRTIVQFDKDDLDAIGIPKFDFLGLGALAAVRRAFDAIEQRTGERLSLYNLPHDDPETFKMIANGDTLGTFQIESRAQIASLVNTKPEKMYDIVVQVALIRPGPIVAKFVHPYTERRRGRAKITYPPGMESRMGPVLDRTQGIPIFQEQAMALAMSLGGYTGSEADELRRTMGTDRKRPKLIAALERFRTRMLANGIADDVAMKIVEDLLSFANYGFPESHAWSFAIIAYATAYLKAHEPAAFYAGLLNAYPMGFYSPATLIHDAKRHQLEVRPPCLVKGDSWCTVENTDDHDKPALRVGWKFIRDIGTPVLDRLIAARTIAPFTSIKDVVRRARLTRKDAAACARSGVFTIWQPDRRQAAWEALRIAGDVLPLAPAHDEHTSRGKPGAFAPRQLEKDEMIALDYRALGLSITGHPMERLRAWCDRMGVLDTASALAVRDKTMIAVAGLVTVRQRPQTAKGAVFLLLEDEHGSLNVIVSKTLDEENREVVRRSKFIAIYGRAEYNGPLVNIIAKRFKGLDDLLEGSSFAYRSHDFH